MSLHFKSNWKKGEVNEYKFIKRKTKVENGNEISKKETSKIIEIEVLKSDKESDLLKWTEFEGSKSLISRIFLKFFKERLDKTFTISYTTTKYGIIDGLVDKEDLEYQTQFLKKQLDIISKTPQEKGLIKDAINDDVIYSRLLKSLYIFHFPYDEEFSEIPLIENIQMANPFMKDNELPGQIINSLLYKDEIKRIGEIQIEKKYDQSLLNAKMKKTLTEIGVKLEKNRKKREKVPLFVATEIFNYKINLDSNWIISGKYEKVLMSKNQENTETIEFKLLK